MNIFYLDSDIDTCAMMHVDKHVVKMIVEYSQLLSTAHRVLDGEEYASGNRSKAFRLHDSVMDEVLYKSTHLNHPSAIWTRSSASAYTYLHSLLTRLCDEYTYRYQKIHKCETSGLLNSLSNIPMNISHSDWTEPTPAMPDQYKVVGDSISSYRAYYMAEKRHIASWKHREVPYWYN